MHLCSVFFAEHLANRYEKKRRPKPEAPEAASLQRRRRGVQACLILWPKNVQNLCVLPRRATVLIAAALNFAPHIVPRIHLYPSLAFKYSSSCFFFSFSRRLQKLSSRLSKNLPQSRLMAHDYSFTERRLSRSAGFFFFFFSKRRLFNCRSVGCNLQPRFGFAEARCWNQASGFISSPYWHPKVFFFFPFLPTGWQYSVRIQPLL